ncbi:hypothetical protein [Sphingomonas panni]|uniref:hypothetical protein n=1 Tax=Sphingomonas panni TaxID=237612 RepID=UPI001F5B1213|nr:hypothetical protein [Sphingomonas panni]
MAWWDFFFETAAWLVTPDLILGPASSSVRCNGPAAGKAGFGVDRAPGTICGLRGSPHLEARRTALFAPPAGRASYGSVELRSTLPGASYSVASIARAA